jgi:hypothetical protein
MQRSLMVQFLIASLAFGCMLEATPTQAQSLYQPYYYTVREQYQTMTDARPPQPPQDQPQHVSYAPDERLSTKTNQMLAQGDNPKAPPPPIAPPPVNTMPVKTIPGIDFGLQGSHYEYNEPGLGVTDSGAKIGVVTSATAAFGPQFLYFATLDFRYAFGQVDYKGSGDKKNEDDNLWEIRGIAGRDFTWNETYDLSPYLGFGYRHLANDARGITSSGASGYRRESQYFYVPLGVKPRIRIDGNSRLTANIEYDQFIHGQQTSDLSDAGLGLPDITNQQDSGYGFRGELMYETDNWSFGPFFNYWNIHGSAIKNSTVLSSTGCAALRTSAPCALSGTEPQNNTTEYGIQLKYRFVTF